MSESESDFPDVIDAAVEEKVNPHPGKIYRSHMGRRQNRKG
jgi:hypothetical protein